MTKLTVAFRNVANAPKNKRLDNFYWKFPNTKFIKIRSDGHIGLQHAIRKYVNEPTRNLCGRLFVYVESSTSAWTVGQALQCLAIFDFQPY
jgi:hypothetical protein